MPGMGSILSGFVRRGKSLARGGIHDPQARKAIRGLREQAVGEKAIPGSFVAMLPQWAAGKVLGKERVRGAAWKYVHGPSLATDLIVGRALEKTPLVGKKLFRTKEKIPWGKDLYKEVERSSALAPLMKVRDFAAPMALAYAAEKGLGALKKGLPPAEGVKQAMDGDLREKVASAMLQLHGENKEHKKRAHATRLLFKQAELGLGEVPQSYSEFEEKLASLINQDLEVFEKALELGSDLTKIGDLGVPEASGLNSEEKFQAAVLGDT